MEWNPDEKEEVNWSSLCIALFNVDEVLVLRIGTSPPLLPYAS